MINLNKHYANALANYGEELGLMDRFYSDSVKILSDTGDPSAVSDELVRFLSLVPKKNRMRSLRHFVRFARSRLGILEAQIISAQPLTSDQLKNIAVRFIALTGKQLDITEKVVPSIIGGVQVLAGNKFYDESIKTQMELMNKNMKEVLIHHAN